MPYQPMNSESKGNRHRLLELLSDGRIHSGQELGRSLSVSRAAVWKTLHSLADCGLPIRSVKGRGYCLESPLELLSRERLLETIGPATADTITALTVLNEVDSTNQFLLERIGRPDFHGHVVLAEYQSAGRGRHGNAWLSPYGSGISLSIGWEFTSPPAAMGIVSLALGVAVIETLAGFGIDNAGLKWPNDILCDGGKLGGILVEMRGELAGPCQLVMGIGLNYLLPGQQSLALGRPVTDIAGVVGTLLSRNAVAARLISRVMDLLTSFDASRIPEILDCWRRYDCVCGKRVTLVTASGTVQGKVAGIDETGSLLLRVGDRISSYSSGDISLHLEQ